MKSWYQSKTLQGQIITLLSMIVVWFKLPIKGEEVASVIGAVFALVGIAYSVYGRIVTKGEKLTK